MTRRIKTRCCGLTLQTGTKIIGFISLISYLTQLVIGVTQASFLKFEDGLLDPVHAFIAIATAIICTALLPCSVLLLQSVCSNTRSILLVPWLIMDIFLRCIHSTILVSGIVLAAKGAVSHGVATVIIMTFGIGLETYLWWIILCYYRELKRHETVCRGAPNCELVLM